MLNLAWCTNRERKFHILCYVQILDCRIVKGNARNDILLHEKGWFLQFCCIWVQTVRAAM